MTTKGENGRAEDLCDYCIRAVNCTLHYLRLSHKLTVTECSSIEANQRNSRLLSPLLEKLYLFIFFDAPTEAFTVRCDIVFFQSVVEAGFCFYPCRKSTTQSQVRVRILSKAFFCPCYKRPANHKLQKI